VTTDERILACTEEPPSDTRAYVRGRVLERFGSDVHTAQWDTITFGVNGRRVALELGSLVEPEQIEACRAAVDQAADLNEFLHMSGVE
jgi:proteasome accessory factor A